MAKITLKAARVNAGYDQKEAAKSLGISNTTLGKWERGETYPTVGKIDEICKLYRIEYDDISFCSQIR